jgi:hypothetical protein
MGIKSFIYVKTQKEGIHCYPAALTDPLLNTKDDPENAWKDVSFLGHLHRHIFHIEVTIEVYHADRDIEFIQFKRWIERLYDQKTLDLDYKSCEMLAHELLKHIQNEYGFDRTVHVNVSEDNENGAIIKYVRDSI